MPTYNDRGFPLYSTGETFPGWATAFNSQSNLLATALDVSEAAVQDGQAVATVADLPVTGNWAGRVIMVEENDMLYVHDGTGWYIYGGKLPYFFGARTVAAVGTGSSRQGYITSTTYTRGITRSGDTITFETPGIYRIDQYVVWEANPTGQRNLGVQGTSITVLGPEESYAFPSTTVDESQSHTTYILATAPGATAQPYVTHNSSAALDVYGSVCVMWVSA